MLLGTVNEDALVPFVSQQLQNLDLAMALARRGNLPGAEGLIVQQFQRLYAGGQYKEAAELAAQSPQGALRTKETIEAFKRVPAQPGQTSPLLVYFGTILTKSQLNALESVELGQLVMGQNKKQLLDNWWKVGRECWKSGGWANGLVLGHSVGSPAGVSLLRLPMSNACLLVTTSIQSVPYGARKYPLQPILSHALRAPPIPISLHCCPFNCRAGGQADCQ